MRWPEGALGILILLCVGCRATSEIESDPQDPAPHARVSGKPLSAVIEQLGDPDEIHEGQFFGTKFDQGPIAAVLRYTKLDVYVYLNDKGIVLAVSKSSTKNFIKW